MYGEPRLGESTIVLDTPNLTKINFSVLGTFRGRPSEKKHPVCKVKLKSVKQSVLLQSSEQSEVK